MNASYIKALLIASVCLPALPSIAQQDSLIGRLTRTPLHYIAHRTDLPPRIDGRMDDPAWDAAPWTEYFSDIEGDIRPRPIYHTRVKMLWDDHYLYIAAEIEEPQVWGNLTHHDDIVFRDNDFEVFLNPENNARHYFELEINALGTTFDLFLPEPYRTGGNALISWNVEGLKKAVHVKGTLNKPGDTDEGWIVELAIPIASISMGNRVETPTPGTLWRINFSRVEWDTEVQGGRYVKRTDPQTQKPLPEHNWVWSPQGVVDMHFPERWGYLLFAGPAPQKDSGKTADTSFVLPLAERLKNCLWETLYRQMVYRQAHGRYTSDLHDLPMDTEIEMDGKHARLTAEATPHTFKAFITCTETGETWSITPEGDIKKEK